MTSQLFRYFRCYVILIFLFSLGMILTSLIPNSALEPQYSKSIAQLENEEIYPNYLFGTDAAIMDNFTDMIMIKACGISEAYENNIQAAFGNNGYPRYWNGYLLLLRPVLTQFSYQQIRYINMFLLLICFCFCFSGILRQLNFAAAIGFCISITACFLVFIGESLQYFSVFILLFITLLIILYIPGFQKTENTALLMFAAGMITNFFDMLTAPLLTIGFPLILILSYNNQKKDPGTIFRQLISIFIHTISWAGGYALCWITKWGIATLIFKENIFEDAIKTANLRINGNEAFPLDRVLMYKLNINTYFFAKGHKPFIFIAAAVIILAVMLILHHKNNIISRMIPVLIVGTFPYFWFFVFANHSQLHYFYTYRIQAISLFSLFAALGSAIDWKMFSMKNKTD